MHQSVLKKEVLEYLDPKRNENFIDATLGQGGHALSILKKNKPQGKVLGIELSPEPYRQLKRRKEKRLIVVNDSFVHLKEIVKENKFEPLSGILFDLGLSSWHLQKSKRGFSFMREEPLDMRYNPQTNKLTAERIVNSWSQKEIEDVLRIYGQERYCRRISKKIINYRPLKTTSQLVEVIRRAFPKSQRHKRIHFATRTFQALRIAVNDELNNLKIALGQAEEIIDKEGRIVVISFHSLEDRIVKIFFKKGSKRGLKILTKKPVTPTKEEIKRNPSSRSAKLRAAVKIA